ncbi:MAG TPA: hypothetical protein DEH10_11725 [Pseudomonas sp.]|nr:hypothetical protein [Pseudomonas sp.]
MPRAFPETTAAAPAGHTQQWAFGVEGMTCASCVARIEKALTLPCRPTLMWPCTLPDPHDAQQSAAGGGCLGSPPAYLRTDSEEPVFGLRLQPGRHSVGCLRSVEPGSGKCAMALSSVSVVTYALLFKRWRPSPVELDRG